MKTSPLPQLALALLLAAAASPSLALYKIVAADGSVTYTDRPPAGSSAKVSTLEGGTVTEVSPLASLPLELRQASERYPVVLYATADCAPCDAGRRMLEQRGIPFTEKRVVSEDDAAALERALGFKTLPALTIGKQALRGWSADEWGAYLDAASYPRESQLPRSWQAGVAEPLVAPRPAVAAEVRPSAVERAQAPIAPAVPPPATPAGGLRF